MEKINVNYIWVIDDDLYVIYYFFISNKVSWLIVGIENGFVGFI